MVGSEWGTSGRKWGVAGRADKDVPRERAAGPREGRGGRQTVPRRRAGFRLVTLTNSAPAAVEQQLSHAGIAGAFERVFSVDAVAQFKPAPDVYRMVARELGVETPQLRMVAAHAWDILGAMRAGYAGAFVARPGKALFPLAAPPDITGPTLLEVAEAIIAADRPLRA